MKMTNKMQPCI